MDAFDLRAVLNCSAAWGLLRCIRKLREADRMLGEGRTIPEVARELEISKNTYHRWRNQYAG